MNDELKRLAEKAKETNRKLKELQERQRISVTVDLIALTYQRLVEEDRPGTSREG